MFNYNILLFILVTNSNNCFILIAFIFTLLYKYNAYTFFFKVQNESLEIILIYFIASTLVGSFSNILLK